MRKNRYRSHVPASLVLALALTLCSVVGPVQAQSGGEFSLTWNTAPGGGGTSLGGQFTLQGTVGQQETEPLQGGEFEITPGFEQPECPAGAAVAVGVTLVPDGSDIRVMWTQESANSAYEVHRSDTPWCTPGPATLLATVLAPGQEFLDEGAAGPAVNRFYLVRARCGGLWGDSFRTGFFSYALTPGG